MYRELQQKTIIDLLNKENNNLFDYRNYRLLNGLYYQNHNSYEYDIFNDLELKNRIKYFYLINFKIILTDDAYHLLIKKTKQEPRYLDSINNKDPEYVEFNKKYPFHYLYFYSSQGRRKEIWELLAVPLKKTKKGIFYLDLNKYLKIKIKLPNKKRNMIFYII